MKRSHLSVLAAMVSSFLGSAALQAQWAFVNWESAHVHPLEMTPDGSRLLAVNLADNRLEVFDIGEDGPIHSASIPVGLDPVSVRARTNNEVWVVNQISDSVSIIDLSSMNVVATLGTRNEPADVIFAGDPQRAFISCSQANTVLVYDPESLEDAPTAIPIDAEAPRALAVSPNGATVYVAIFESGNGSTVLGGGLTLEGDGVDPPNVVSDPLGPYGGVNPPPNHGANFLPAQNPDNPSPPPVSLIVKKNADGQWMDDNGGDWTEFVSGELAGHSGRPVGWDLPDHDVAIINTTTLAVDYATRLMNICMAIAVNPASGAVAVVGTDALNEVRFEPVQEGRFLRVNTALFDAATPNDVTVVDLNGHLEYTDEIPFQAIPESERNKSIGDPRGIVWNSAGTRGYVSGMGSDNVIVIDAQGERVGREPTIEVGVGPTGLVIDEPNDRLYVLNKFSVSISVVDLETERQLFEVPFYDPTPELFRTIRYYLYDTHFASGLGHASCGSCHVDGRTDRLAWDVGDPSGQPKEFNQNCGLGLDLGCEDWHPMKGPMVTMTLQDIIGKEPLHWRGDRDGLSEFVGTFFSLLGHVDLLTVLTFDEFLETITLPPNPYRNLDNSLPTDLPLDGHFTTGRFGPPGGPLPNGNAQVGLDLYRKGFLGSGDNQCVTCHTLPTGLGPDLMFSGIEYIPIPPGPLDEHHHSVVSDSGFSNLTMKIPQLRTLYRKVGFDRTQTTNRSGFGFLHDGSVDSLARFVSEPIFNVASDQDVADLVAFLLSFSGSDLPVGNLTDPMELVGPASKDTHAAVGVQTTLDDAAAADPDQLALIQTMIELADSNAVGLVVKGKAAGIGRGYVYIGSGEFQSDRASEVLATQQLLSAAASGSELTFTVVPSGSEFRIGVDRDADGFFDRDELDECSDPADASSVPGSVIITGDSDGDGDVDLCDYGAFRDCFTGPEGFTDSACGCLFDFDRDGDVDLTDWGSMQVVFDGG